MKKFLIILAAASLLAAGCEIKREGYVFIITTQPQGTIIEGQQAKWDLRPDMSTPLMITQPGLQPIQGLTLPQ